MGRSLKILFDQRLRFAAIDQVFRGAGGGWPHEPQRLAAGRRRPARRAKTALVLFVTDAQRFRFRLADHGDRYAAATAAAPAGRGRRVATVHLQRVQRFLGLQFGRQVVDGSRVGPYAGDPLDRAHRVRAVQRAPRAAQTTLGTRPLDGFRHARRAGQCRPLRCGRRLCCGLGRRYNSSRRRRFLRGLWRSKTARSFRQLGFPRYHWSGRRLERVCFPKGGCDRPATAVGVVAPATVGSRYRFRGGFLGLKVPRRSLLAQRFGRHQANRFFEARKTKIINYNTIMKTKLKVTYLPFVV